MQNLLFTSLLLLLLPVFLPGQAIYNGHVRDVSTRIALSDVQVELLHSDQQVQSNYFGDFILRNTEKDSIPQAINTYHFFNNSMIWEGTNQVSLEIFAMDGRLISKADNMGTSGSYLFPAFPMGIYILRVSTREERQSFKAFSNGQRTSIADKGAVWHYSSVPLKADTLRLSKAGYYPRMIPLSGRDTLIDISLLKKENEELHYFNELIDPIAFDLISTTPSRTNQGEAISVKIISNIDDDLMYYMNSKRYKYHFNFAQIHLGFNQGNNVFNQTQYLENEHRYLYPANLNYYKNLDIYVLYLVSANEMSCEKIKDLYDKVVATSYLEGKLFLYSNRPEFNLCEVPQISTAELYAGQNYQALNLTENYGYLKKVDLADLEESYLGRHDILMLNGVPNDVSVVGGIITTEFQTPLSHINVLSHNRGTPNMALRDAWENELLEDLLDQLVYLKVSADSFAIRTATLAEAEAFWAEKEPQEIIDLPKDVSVQGLIDLEMADYTFLDKIGGKATNFAEMLNVAQTGIPIPTPESSFAIPFYYYDQHLKTSGLDQYINQLLQDADFMQNPAIRKAKLEDLQDKIKDHPIDPVLLELVQDKIKDFKDYPSFRFRSSTNAEDLESFSGAGLYSSYSAKKNNSKKTIERAIKKVWASLWNWRAFEERAYYKIVHTSCAMGILVHRSFPDEDANGVVVTKNLYNDNPGYIINVQYKEYSIVFPEPGILNDQIMLLAWSVDPNQDFMIEYLTFSNIPELEGAPVMTDEELFELGKYCKALKEYFYYNVPHNCNCPLENFALDIEFKVDSQVSERKIYVKQARYYK